jgi:hypothetical protein
VEEWEHITNVQDFLLGSKRFQTENSQGIEQTIEYMVFVRTSISAALGTQNMSYAT